MFDRVKCTECGPFLRIVLLNGYDGVLFKLNNSKLTDFLLPGVDFIDSVLLNVSKISFFP